jgi:outer membrane receptor for ferrienterochelin and colicin
LYYQTPRFGFHANYNYRSKYLSSEQFYFGDGLYVDGYGQLNLSADYHLSHWLTLNAGITNVTQSAFTEVDRYEVLADYALSGRQYELGLTAQF